MTMQEFKQWLEDRIAILGPALERLLNARKAIEEAEQGVGLPEAPKITAKLGKPQPALRGPYRVKTAPDKPEWQRVRGLILKGLAERPMRSADIIDFVYQGEKRLGKREKDRVYAALSHLRESGALTRSAETAHWSLASESEALVRKEASNG